MIIINQMLNTGIFSDQSNVAKAVSTHFIRKMMKPFLTIKGLDRSYHCAKKQDPVWFG